LTRTAACRTCPSGYIASIPSTFKDSSTSRGSDHTTIAAATRFARRICAHATPVSTARRTIPPVVIPLRCHLPCHTLRQPLGWNEYADTCKLRGLVRLASFSDGFANPTTTRSNCWHTYLAAAVGGAGAWRSWGRDSFDAIHRAYPPWRLYAVFRGTQAISVRLLPCRHRCAADSYSPLGVLGRFMLPSVGGSPFFPLFRDRI